MGAHQNKREEMGPAQEGWIKGTMGAVRRRCRHTKEARERARGCAQGVTMGQATGLEWGRLPEAQPQILPHTCAHTHMQKLLGCTALLQMCVPMAARFSFTLAMLGAQAGESGHNQQFVSLPTTCLQRFLLRKNCNCYTALFNSGLLYFFRS